MSNIFVDNIYSNTVGDHVKLHGPLLIGSPFNNTISPTVGTTGTLVHGGNNTANAGNSHVGGYNSTANGYASHAEGLNTTTNAIYAHTEGWDTVGNGTYSHAEGHQTTASSQASHSEGFGTSAEGPYSHAEGYNTIANGFAAHSEGRDTIADGGYSSVVGKYNLPDATQAAFIIGNGSDNFNRSNLLLAAANQVEIFGKTKTETIQISDGAFDGYVLTSDASGNGTWQSIAGISDTFVTAASLNGTNLEIDRNNGQPQITVDLASINTDTFVVSGAYDDVSNTITLTRNDAGTIDITGIADSYVTGAALNGSTLELTRNEGLPTLSVDLSSLLDNTTDTVDAGTDPNVNADIIFYSASIPAGVITLNSALNVAGKKVVLIRVADTNTVTLAAAGSQINGSGTKALPTLLYSTTTCISDGTNWYCTNGSVL